jgi:hypothetical protein
MTTNASQRAAGRDEQYTLAKILGLWVAVSAPMGLLAWVVFPVLKDSIGMHPGIFLQLAWCRIPKQKGRCHIDWQQLGQS